MSAWYWVSSSLCGNTKKVMSEELTNCSHLSEDCFMNPVVVINNNINTFAGTMKSCRQKDGTRRWVDAINHCGTEAREWLGFTLGACWCLARGSSAIRRATKRARRWRWLLGS